jgi:hypothetical protein
MTEGMSIRAISRVTGIHKTTILSLPAYASPHIQLFMSGGSRVAIGGWSAIDLGFD